MFAIGIRTSTLSFYESAMRIESGILSFVQSLSTLIVVGLISSMCPSQGIAQVVIDDSPPTGVVADQSAITATSIVSNCQCQDCGGCRGCGRCSGLTSCQCPLEPAPCIDCPRVSTLSPNFNIKMFGTLKLDMLFSQPGVVAFGTPFFLSPESQVGFDQSTVSINARQSSVGAMFTGPSYHGFQSGGQMLAMFYNDAVTVDSYGFLPLQAFGELKNDDWRFAAGLMFDVFSPGIPTVLPFSALGASGNTGNTFRGQVRLERFLGRTPQSQWTLQAALSQPITSTIDPTFRLSEDNGWPNIEGRIAWGAGQPSPAGARPFEVGVSGVGGQIRTTELLNRQVVADVYGIGTDFRWAMTPRFGFSGEFYTGQGLGTYNGGILQNINFDTTAPANSTLDSIRTSGGWMEAYYYWTPCLHTHTGYGIDDPNDRDIAQTQRTSNSTLYANMLWDINQTFRIGFEFAYRKTGYLAPQILDNSGPSYQTQFQWAF